MAAHLQATDHHTALGDTGWRLWREAALRSAGFPADRFFDLCDPELAAAADRVNDAGRKEHYASVFAAAAGRLSTAIRRTATDPRFREAVTWQNPGLIETCLDRAALGEPRNVRGRNHEATIASYLQRYCLKNDTVGFFGPVGWARIEAEQVGMVVAPRAPLLSHRTTYFESWTIDSVANAIAARPEVWPWLRPRRARSVSLAGSVLSVPFRKSVRLSPAELRVLGLCDGSRTVRDIAGEPLRPATVATLLALRDSGAVCIDLLGPVTTWPEQELRQRIDEIVEPRVRASARASLDDLVAARDQVAAAAGDATRLESAMRWLAQCFVRTTGRAPTRRNGATYAGRTLVYEDTVRGVDVKLGRLVTDRLAASMGIVLDSATWLANTVAERYETAALQVLTGELNRRGARELPFLQLLPAVMPEIGRPDVSARSSKIVNGVLREFQQRWQRVLRLPVDTEGDVHLVERSSALVGPRAAQEFAVAPGRWSAAGWHSPDLMLASSDGAALRRGDVEFVLGELHCATNTLESRLFVEQHPRPDRLRAAAFASGMDRRIETIPRRDAPTATSRMSRAAALMLPDYKYLTIGDEALAPPPGAVTVPALELVAHIRDGEVMVRRRDGEDEYRFVEAAGDALCALVADAFRPLPSARHHPRVVIDRLVLCREAWTFAAGKVSWAFTTDEATRYAQARCWRREHGIPERAFVRVRTERKPMAVDFRSLPLVNLLAKSIRRATELDGTSVTITEMLPDLDRLWLRDREGAAYTAELRLVATASDVRR